jgi:hypothetical protein
VLDLLRALDPPGAPEPDAAGPRAGSHASIAYPDRRLSHEELGSVGPLPSGGQPRARRQRRRRRRDVVVPRAARAGIGGAMMRCDGPPRRGWLLSWCSRHAVRRAPLLEPRLRSTRRRCAWSEPGRSRRPVARPAWRRAARPAYGTAPAARHGAGTGRR